MGMDDYLSKPLDISALVEKLSYWTQRAAVTRAATASASAAGGGVVVSDAAPAGAASGSLSQ